VNIELRLASDSLYAEQLTASNMANYYHRRDWSWDHQRFLKSWIEFDNFEIFVNGIRVGLVRFSYRQATTYLRDIQLEGEYQGKGVGSKVLQLIKLHGQSRGSKRLALRVFSENPVINLYKTMGFMQLAEVDGLVEMQLLLNAPVD
jgi:GNAT superfamily N-acetyltransferase